MECFRGFVVTVLGKTNRGIRGNLRELGGNWGGNALNNMISNRNDILP